MRSPGKDALLPVNEKNGRGTGIGTLIPTWFPNFTEISEDFNEHVAWDGFYDCTSWYPKKELNDTKIFAGSVVENFDSSVYMKQG